MDTVEQCYIPVVIENKGYRAHWYGALSVNSVVVL